MEDVDARVHIYAATTLRRGRVASLTLSRLYPGESPWYSFYRRLSGPQDQSGHEGVKKNLHPSNTQDQTQAVQPVCLDGPGSSSGKAIGVGGCGDFS